MSGPTRPTSAMRSPEPMGEPLNEQGSAMTVGHSTPVNAGRGAEARMLSRRFMMRVAGLPIEALHGLRCPETRRRADELLCEEARLRTLGADLSDRLGALVKANE